MTVLALITRPEEAAEVVRWSSRFAAARKAPLRILCWSYSPHRDIQRTGVDSSLVDEVRQVASAQGVAAHAGTIDYEAITHRDAAQAIVEEAKDGACELLVTAAFESNLEDRTSSAATVLHNAPCSAVVLHARPDHIPEGDNIMVSVTDGPHDSVALFLAHGVADVSGTEVTLMRTEEANTEEEQEVGERELGQMIRDAGITDQERIHTQVFNQRDIASISESANRHALVVMGANAQGSIRRLLRLTSNPTIALVKRAPALKVLAGGGAEWIPHLSPADYTDLVQGLRRGSKLNTDFVVMLTLAAGIATLGLLQDSGAVVIGSMLLAPLMTPMLGGGIALSMGNAKLAKDSATAIVVGFVLALAVSFVVALLTPGSELTPEVLARTEPNILDLLVAAASGAAAAYALARPNLAGSIAGVAIATALVPPLCSVGASIAYAEWTGAWGAWLLFTTNVVAIILGASGVFRLLGITAERRAARRRPRVWVQRTVTGLATGALIIAIPLQLNLLRHLEGVKPQPNTFPLPKSVLDEVHQYVETVPDLELVSAGKPASDYSSADVILVLTSSKLLTQKYAEDLVRIVRDEIGDQELEVVVHGLLEAWETVDTEAEEVPEEEQGE